MEHVKRNGLDNLGSIDQIRELLFGVQLKEIHQSIQSLENRFNQLEEDMVSSLADLKEGLFKRLDDEMGSMRKHLKQSTVQLQEEITDMQDQSLKLERRMQAASNVRAQEIEDIIEANKIAAYREIDALKGAVDKVHEEMMEQLHHLAESINEQQLSKEMMSELLMNMALQVKGVSLELETEKTLH